MAESVSITICGDGGCGKSSITLRLVRSQWTHEYDPTIEDSYSVTRTVDGLPYFLALTDTAGQEEYRGLWASSNLKSDAFLLVYDITNPTTLDTLDYFMDMIDIEAEQRLENTQRLLKEVRKKAGKGEEDIAVGMAPPVKIVAGNKCDLKDARVVSARQGLEYARKRQCGFMETSAREMVNIEETFALIVRRVVEARRRHHQEQFPHLYQQSLQVHSGTYLTPYLSADLITASSGDSHSRTPALTPMEQEISDINYNAKTGNLERPNQWLGLRRKISQHIGRRRKSNDTLEKDGDTYGTHGRGTEGQIGNPAGRARGENSGPRQQRHQEKQTAEDRDRDGDRILTNERSEREEVHQSMWRRVGCRGCD